LTAVVAVEVGWKGASLGGCCDHVSNWGSLAPAVTLRGPFRLLSWSCEFDSPHPLHSESPSAFTVGIGSQTLE